MMKNNLEAFSLWLPSLAFNQTC